MEHKHNVISSTVALAGLVVSHRYLTQAGFKLSIAAACYFTTERLLYHFDNQSDKLLVTRQEFDFLQGQLGPKAKFLNLKYVTVTDSD